MTKLYSTKKFVLTNSVTGKREEFKPQDPNNVLYYSCGPTVYGPLHIGNARALIVSDMLFRWMTYIGYNVNFVRNYTDVDDKIIVKAKEEKISALEVAEKYIDYCETDIRSLGLKDPVKKVRVTESMDDIIQMIEKIIARKHAYVVDGEVLYSIDSFKSYGKLSGRNVEELQAGARVEVDAKKKNPMDFSLWKPAKPGEPSWDSPWGKGRPGWHIECSAMIGRWLGDTIDVHHGGQDLIFPHHENEIAQSEAATGKPFCNHWMHNGFLTMGQEKMSKSLGNLISIREFVTTYSAEVLKYIYVAHHFRSGVEFSDELIAKTLHELERVYSLKAWAENSVNAPEVAEIFKNEVIWKTLSKKVPETFDRMIDEMFLDINTPGALGHLFTLTREVNRSEVDASGKPGTASANTPSKRVFANEVLQLLDERIFPLFNVFGMSGADGLKLIQSTHEKLRGPQITGEEIQKLIDARIAARVAKDFKKADEIRVQLDQSGVIVIDSPQGTTWKYK